MRGRISFIGGGKCNEIDRLIARAKVRVLKCITVVVECNARTCSNTKRQLYGE